MEEFFSFIGYLHRDASFFKDETFFIKIKF